MIKNQPAKTRPSLNGFQCSILNIADVAIMPEFLFEQVLMQLKVTKLLTLISLELESRVPAWDSQSMNVIGSSNGIRPNI